MGNMKTPGVYIREKSAFPNSVVEAPTAIPAFIGFTQKAENGADSLIGVPWRISSMTEFLKFFGGAPKLDFTMNIVKYDPAPKVGTDKKVTTRNGLVVKPDAGIFQYAVEQDGEEVGEDGKPVPVKTGYAFGINGNNSYTLYYNMVLFFANGGGTCYVVSVGTYGTHTSVSDTDKKDELTDKKVDEALKSLEKEQEVTMIIIPEAVENKSYTNNIQQLMLKHCGEMANRFAILDIPPKYPDNNPLKIRSEIFQGNIGSSYLSYGAAYFPWLNASVLGDKDLTGDIFTYDKSLTKYSIKFTGYPTFGEIISTFTSPILLAELKGEDNIADEKPVLIKGEEVTYGKVIKNDVIDPEFKLKDVEKLDIKWDKTNKTVILYELRDTVSNSEKNAFHLAMCNGSVLYQLAMKAVKKYLNQLPPSAAMAGIYTMVDNSRGVWKAPANVTLSYVDSVTEDIDNDQQADLNAPMNGKAINVIRPFQGEGIKVWGARTLDGNSLDWRYINVRRTLLFLEESVKNASRAYVFEPNDANTWINMKCMIENFLRSVWKRGGLAGATPEDAFSVHVGLGDTMTPDDILDGILRITVLVAVTHPAEFIEITFQQQMQKS